MANKFGFSLVSDGKNGFRLEYTPPKRETKPVHSGERLRERYIAVYDQCHNRRFKFERMEDQYARIQSYKDDCLIANIIGRCANGDLSPLQKVRGMYADVSGMSMDLRTAHDILNNAQGVFNGLSQEEKVKYNNDFKSFLDGFGTVEGITQFIQSKVNIAAPAPAVTASEEVKTDA